MVLRCASQTIAQEGDLNKGARFQASSTDVQISARENKA